MTPPPGKTRTRAKVAGRELHALKKGALSRRTATPFSSPISSPWKRVLCPFFTPRWCIIPRWRHANATWSPVTGRGLASGHHRMYSPGVEDQLRHEIDAVVNDIDVRTFIVRTGSRADVPEALGDLWASKWGQAELLRLAGSSQAARQDDIAVQVRGFFDDPAVTLERVNHAAAQAGEPDLRLQGEVAQAVGAELVRFNAEVLTRSLSSFTGKVRYGPITDVDVETTKAIIEVTSQADAGGKLPQLQELLGREVNPYRKPVLHFMPNASHGAEAALMAGGSHGVYRDLPALLAALHVLP
jgi:hypothetical protein